VLLGAPTEAVDDRLQLLLHEAEDAEQENLLNRELQTADEPDRDERSLDQGHPDEVLHLVSADVTKRNPEEPYAGSHPAK